MTQLACIWTKHADMRLGERLGERFGSKSDKIKLAIEDMIARGEYTEIEDGHPAPGKIAIRLDVRENPVGLVIQSTNHKPIIVTILPKFINKRSRRSWGRI